MAPKTRNVKDEDSNKQHRVDDERFGGLVYKLPGVAVRDCRRKRIRDKVSVFVRQRPSAAIPEMTQLRLTGRVLLSPYAVDDLGFTIVADGVESAAAGTNAWPRMVQPRGGSRARRTDCQRVVAGRDG